jgi:hypothetical protein
MGINIKQGAWDKSLVTIFAPPLSARPTRFSDKYEPVFAFKTHETDENNRHKSDDETFVPDSKL